MKEDKVIEAVIDEEKPFFFPRFIAFIIDSIIVFIISVALVAVLPANPNHEKYLKELESIQTDMMNKKINASESFNRMKDVVYDVDYTNVLVSLTQVVVFIGYFVIFQYKNKGQTLGKKLMKLKVVSTDTKELNLNQVAVRALICDSIFINLLLVACVLFISRDYYYYASFGLQLLNYGIIIVALFMILFRKDGKGLHDLVAKTKVVNAN